MTGCSHNFRRDATINGSIRFESFIHRVFFGQTADREIEMGRLLCLLAAWAFAGCLVAQAIPPPEQEPKAKCKVGDRLTVITRTNVMREGKVVGSIRESRAVTVQDVEKDRVWVCREVPGWINTRDVRTPDEAMKIFDKAIKKNPRDSMALVNRGNVWMVRYEHEKSLHDYDAAIRLDSENAEAFGGRGAALLWRLEHDKALAAFNRAIQLDPKTGWYLVGRGKAWRAKKDYDRAIADLTAAIKLHPEACLIYCVRGLYRAKTADREGFRADFQAAEKVNPKSLSFLPLRGLAYRILWQFDKAVADWKTAVRRNPQDHATFFSLANLRLYCPNRDYRDPPQAIKYARTACELSKWKTSWAISGLADAYAANGDYTQAAKWQQKAIELAPPKKKEKLKNRLKQYRRIIGE